MGGRTVEWVRRRLRRASPRYVVLPRPREAGGPGGLVDLVARRGGQPRRLQLHGPHGRARPGVDGEPSAPVRAVGRPVDRADRRRLGRLQHQHAARSSTASCCMIERPDLIEDGDWVAMPRTASAARRGVERDRSTSGPREHTTAEIVELAVELRIPVAPVCDGRTRARARARSQARGVLRRRPDGHVHDAPPSVADRRRARAAAAPGAAPRRAHADRGVGPTPARGPGRRRAARRCRCDGVRVLDLTAWWAGPSATGAARRARRRRHPRRVGRPGLDGMRLAGGVYFDRPDQWWELQRVLPRGPTPTSATSRSTSTTERRARARAAT